jgi:hypothetical protein
MTDSAETALSEQKDTSSSSNALLENDHAPLSILLEFQTKIASDLQKNLKNLKNLLNLTSTKEAALSLLQKENTRLQGQIVTYISVSPIFIKFQQLPTEIRHRIWSLSIGVRLVLAPGKGWLKSGMSRKDNRWLWE